MDTTHRITGGLMLIAALLLGGWAWAQEKKAAEKKPPPDKAPAAPSAADTPDTETDGGEADDQASAPAPAPRLKAKVGSVSAASPAEAAVAGSRRQGFVASLTIFALAVFVGFEVITKVPPTLHTPLMSGSNAISGITVVGAVIVASAVVESLRPATSTFAHVLGFVAVSLATINVVGGFLVTHRMLAMFKRK